MGDSGVTETTILSTNFNSSVHTEFEPSVSQSTSPRPHSPTLHIAASASSRDPPAASLGSSSPSYPSTNYSDHPLTSEDAWSSRTPVLDEEHDHHSTGGSARNSISDDDRIFDDFALVHQQSPHISPPTSHASSRRNSNDKYDEEIDDDEISILPTQSRVSSLSPSKRAQSSPYAPLTPRSPFRRPSSVRGIILNTTPPENRTSPHFSTTSSHLTPTRSRTSTPRSRMRSARSERTPTVTRTAPAHRMEAPLVLLHVTVLPLQMPYSQEVLEAADAKDLIEQWKILKDKVAGTVMERGILIPHPKEEYELLEERILESLELKTERVLKCGHFNEGTSAVCESEDEEAEAVHFEGESCEDCGRAVKDGRFGVGEGKRRWEVRVYAANGLMRSGAWSAAWKEMERVDVEIEPWIKEDLKVELEGRKEEMSVKMEAEEEDLSYEEVENNGVNVDRLKEIYGEEAQEKIDGLLGVPENKNRKEGRRVVQQHRDVDLGLLLQNYLRLVLSDPRNVAIGILGFLVLFLAFGTVKAAASPGTDLSIIPNAILMSSEDIPLRLLSDDVWWC